MKHLLKLYEEIQVIDSYGNVKDALEGIKSQKPDVIFLDINMPEKSGFDLVDEIEDERIQIVFVTAYDQYAIQAFDRNALDYLLKPIEPKRLQQCISKLLNQNLGNISRNPFETNTKQKLTPASKLYFKEGDEIRFLDLHAVILFSAFGNYIKVFLDNKMHLLYGSLNQLEERLESQSFFRANRYTIVPINKIKTIIPAEKSKLNLVLINDAHILCSERKSVMFKRQFGI